MIERVSAPGGGQLDADTVVSEGSFRRRCTRPAARCSSSSCSSRGDAPPGSARTGRRATTPSAARRWGSACSTTSRSPPGTRSTSSGSQRVLILDWDVHHGNGTNDIFHCSDRACCSSRSTSRRCIPAPGRPPTSEPARAGATPSTCRCRPASGDDDFRSLVEHVVAPARARLRARAGADLGRLTTPTATTRSPTASVTEAGFAAMAAAMRRRRRDELGIAPVGCVLEGGYDLGALARSVAATLEALRPTRRSHCRRHRRRSRARGGRLVDGPASVWRSGGRRWRRLRNLASQLR